MFNIHKITVILYMHTAAFAPPQTQHKITTPDKLYNHIDLFANPAMLLHLDHVP